MREPTTDDVRIGYANDTGTLGDEWKEVLAGFDRWLDQVKADAWDEGYKASDDEAYFFSTHGRTPNPYREQEEA